MADSRPFGYGYPSYIETPFQASRYDARIFNERMFAETGRQNAAYEKMMADRRAAAQPDFLYTPTPPWSDPSTGTGHCAPWAGFGTEAKPDSSTYTHSKPHSGRGQLLWLFVGLVAAGSVLLQLL